MLFSWQQTTLVITVFIAAFLALRGIPSRAQTLEFNAYEAIVVVGIDGEGNVQGFRVPQRNAEACNEFVIRFVNKLEKLGELLPPAIICQAAGIKA